MNPASCSEQRSHSKRGLVAGFGRITGNPEVIDSQFFVWRPTTWWRAVNGAVSAIGIFASFPIRMRMNHIPELASSTPCKCVNKSCNVEQRGRRDPDQRILEPEDSG